MDDREIVALYLRRQEDAIARTDEKYRWLCFRLAGNILPRREDQEECVNDAYLGLWNTIPPKEPQRLGAYLARITRNFAIDRWRSDQARKRGGGQIACALEELEQTLSGAVKTVRENELYTPTAFAGGNAVRKILEYSMGDQASADRDTVLERIAAGQSAEAAMAEFLTDDYFEAWYQATLAQLQQYEG